jgi:hypothetical protein
MVGQFKVATISECGQRSSHSPKGTTLAGLFGFRKKLGENGALWKKLC